ncbi:Calcium/proton exchanger protein [Dioscorea alata]|uniref:Calcium/proton exchanger protein n=1 Tax=Dioscorea alata TaxID=55571 RepID=A0ACB7WI23_DIOAL|nr:Calcium/proton exchanger protein [Dioscorea alata]
MSLWASDWKMRRSLAPWQFLTGHVPILWYIFSTSVAQMSMEISESRPFSPLHCVQMSVANDISGHELGDESPVSLARKGGLPPANKAHSSSLSECEQGFSIEYLQARLVKSVKIVMLTTKLNLLLPCGPAAIVVNYLTAYHGCVFLLSLLGIIPLAERLGFATEQLAFFTGPTAGGLLNATFGNATELIISIFALKSGMLRVVQQSLLGSILSNILLVLGCAFFCGGISFHKEQVFNKSAATMNSGLLLIAVMGLLSPAVLHYTHTEAHFGASELALSRFTSSVMLLVYAFYIVFQLKNQKVTSDHADEEESADNDVAEISKWEAIIWLAVIAAWISVLSEYLVKTIEGASLALKIPIAFISVVLLPVVGNAAEHASAITFAMKDKLDISVGVAIGSSTQIAMFGIPFSVVLGWLMGRPIDLNFQLFETAILFITVLVLAFMLQDGSSNYFKGMMLVLCYLIVAASFYVHVDPKPNGDTAPLPSPVA